MCFVLGKTSEQPFLSTFASPLVTPGPRKRERIPGIIILTCMIITVIILQLNDCNLSSFREMVSLQSYYSVRLFCNTTFMLASDVVSRLCI